LSHSETPLNHRRFPEFYHLSPASLRLQRILDNFEPFQAGFPLKAMKAKPMKQMTRDNIPDAAVQAATTPPFTVRHCRLDKA
jgi:hypothetical protein